MQRLLGFAAIAFLLGSGVLPASAQKPGSWKDPSTHRVQFVTVEDDVQLEVLDWGGTGPPVVLLAGYNTAHVFDGFAEKLAKTCHVYGITRRGYGASSRPDSGYTAQRSAEDVLEVLDALKLEAPVLAGHSFGGQEVTTLGATHPERIAGLVYLNSAEDPTLVWADYGLEFSAEQHEEVRKKLPAAMRNPPPPPDYTSFQAYREWQKRAHGVAFPESELRQMFTANPDGSMGPFLPSQSVRDAIFAGRQKPDYASIRATVLAFFAVSASLESQIERYKPQNAEQRAAMKQAYAADLAIKKKHRRDLQAGVPAARVTEVPGANWYVFLSNETEVLREMRVFVAGLR